MVLQDNTTDILLCGGGAGSSKSYTCLLKGLMYAQDPAARILIVRESYPLLKLPGGLVDESQTLYRPFKPEWRAQPLTYAFKNGAEIKFAAIPQNVQEWQGLQASHILVDEASTQTEESILFLLSRLRSGQCKIHKNITMTANPDRNSFLYNWIEYCLDPETGIPKEGTENIIRYFVSVSGVLKWGDSVEELREKYYDQLGEHGFMPKSFRFIPMTIVDNPTLMKNDPSYYANLLAQPRVNQQRYLYGSWTARPSSSSYFSRDWVDFVDQPPTEVTGRVRAYDLAASEVSEQNKNPDYTAGVLVSRDRMGIFYIEHATRYRKKPDSVLREIVKTAKQDGLDVPVILPRDPGAGGIAANRFYVSTLSDHGLYVRTIPTTGHGGKLHKFLPVSALAEAGVVKIVRDTPEDRWNEDFLVELEFFTGGRNEKNDQADATSDAFKELARGVTYPTFVIPNFTQESPVPRL